MYPRPRYRRSTYGYERQSRFPLGLQRLIALAVFLFIVYWIFKFILGLFGVGNAVQREASPLLVEGQGIISVSLQGAQSQAAENGMNLFAGDSVVTGATTNATLRHFEGSWSRIDTQSEIAIDTASHGKKESELALELKQGTMWVYTPAAEAFTGAIVRRVNTPAMELVLPPGTDASVTARSLFVYDADGDGVEVSVGKNDPIFVGEGQKLVLPEEGTVKNPSTYRSALTPADHSKAFVTQSRQKILERIGQESSVGSTLEPLTLDAPAEGFVLKEDMFEVRGKANSDVVQVTINDKAALLDAVSRTYSQEVSPPQDAANFTLIIKALDADGDILATIERTIGVRRVTEAMEAPVIASPAATGETYRTNAEEIVIRGTSPKTAAGIFVNEYKLQLFTPEKGTWSYLASKNLGNLKDGTNIFDVTAVDADGQRSAAARITIIIGEGEGTTPAPSTGSTSSKARAENPATFPNNAPLTPGSLSVTGPTAGLTHVETGTGFLLEGKTSAATASVWVNDYKLQLYTPGKTFWNYIAQVAYGNLKPGPNVYKVIARNEKGEVLDVLEYKVQYNP